MCQVFEERGVFMIKLTGDEARKIVWGQHRDWQTVESNLTNTDKWSFFYQGIFKYIPIEKYYKFEWNQDKDEYQDEDFFDRQEEVILKEVHKVAKMVEVWEEK